jgi:hypothetical protein
MMVLFAGNNLWLLRVLGADGSLKYCTTWLKGPFFPQSQVFRRGRSKLESRWFVLTLRRRRDAGFEV